MKTFHLFLSQVVNQELSCVHTQVAPYLLSILMRFWRKGSFGGSQKNFTLKFPIVEISNSPKKAWQPSFKKSKSGIQVLDNSNNRENLLHIFLGSPQRLLAANLPAKALLSAQVCYRKVANLCCGLKVFQCEGHLSSLWKTLRIGCKNASTEIFLPPLLLGYLAHKPGGQQLRVASWWSWRSSIVSWIWKIYSTWQTGGLSKPEPRDNPIHGVPDHRDPGGRAIGSSQIVDMPGTVSWWGC